MSHEPTRDEWLSALAAYSEHKRTTGEASITTALTAANAIRDKRIRAEALEEAADFIREFDTGQSYDANRHRMCLALFAAIRALKDKTDE